MEANRQQWNEDLKTLRGLLESGSDHAGALRLCLRLHAQTHSAALDGAAGWSFQDEVLEGLSLPALRVIPPGGEHSIAWIVWHLARCEDITMNLLAAGTPQVLLSGGWAGRVGGGIVHTGNAMDAAAVAAFSAAVDLEALLAYRLAVARRTREVIGGLQSADILRKVDPARMALVTAQGALLPEAHEVYAYWASRSTAGLLLMPATRHNFVHLNEALRFKSKVVKGLRQS